jgi:hypothetical protein
MGKRIFIISLLSGFLSLGGVYAAENLSDSKAESVDACVAVNSAGQVGVIWIERTSDSNKKVYYSIRSGGKWSAAAAMPGQSANNQLPRIARGVSGGFVAAWHDQTNAVIRFSQYNGSWSTPISVSPTGGYDLGSPAVTTTSNGRIAVAYQRGNKTFPDIYVNTCKNGSWSGPVNVSDTPYGSKYPDLTSGPGGEIYVVWQDNLYISSTGVDYFYTEICNDRGNGNWTKPQIIDGQEAWTFRPMVAVNSSRDILAPFFFYNGKAYWAAYYLNGSWQNPQCISDVGRHQEHNLYWSATCPFGSNGFLFIYRNCGLNVAYRVIQNGNVSKDVIMTSGGVSYHPYIAYASSVGAVAVWTNRSGNYDVWASIFNPEDVEPEPEPPPTVTIQPPLGVEANYLDVPLVALNLKTELVVNRNLFTVQYFRKLNWAVDPAWSDWPITLSKYRIYRKLKTASSWVLLAEVNSSVLQYIDTNGVTAEERYDYKVKGVDSLGNEYYAYNWIRWAPNPENSQQGIKVKGYRIYRKKSGQSADSYAQWQAVDSATNSVEDHSIEIRENVHYNYAVSAVRDTGEESTKAEAHEIAGSWESPPRQRL